LLTASATLSSSRLSVSSSFSRSGFSAGALNHLQQLIDNVVLVKLPGADVHGNGEQCHLGLARPHGQLAAGSLENPKPEWQNQAGFLAQPDELPGQDQTAPGTLPA
jgi:hypothetical protein